MTDKNRPVLEGACAPPPEASTRILGCQPRAACAGYLSGKMLQLQPQASSLLRTSRGGFSRERSCSFSAFSRDRQLRPKKPHLIRGAASSRWKVRSKSPLPSPREESNQGWGLLEAAGQIRSSDQVRLGTRVRSVRSVQARGRVGLRQTPPDKRVGPENQGWRSSRRHNLQGTSFSRGLPPPLLPENPRTRTARRYESRAHATSPDQANKTAQSWSSKDLLKGADGGPLLLANLPFPIDAQPQANRVRLASRTSIGLPVCGAALAPPHMVHTLLRRASSRVPRGPHC